MQNPDFLLCTCNSAEHQVVFFLDDDTHEAFLEIHLCNHSSIWARIKNGIKYIFGYKCIYGHFDEIILDSRHADKILELGNFLKEGEKIKT